VPHRSDASRHATIYVLAGPNGSGKSSIGGELLAGAGRNYFNPDAHARRIRERSPMIGVEQANGIAWNVGRAGLARAIAMQQNYAFETTLGGHTIATLLAQAAQRGLRVRVWFVGLASADLNVERVRRRAAAGGHDIPEAAIRRRYDAARLNLIGLLPDLDEVWLHDNSEEADPAQGREPHPRLLLHLVGRRIVAPASLLDTPKWAKPIVAAALKLGASRSRQ
jgi:predicted ABC-type ATPase